MPAASEAGLRLALDRAAFEARIVEASWYGDRAAALPLGEAFHARRLRPDRHPGRRGRAGDARPADHAERLALALALLDDARYDALLDGPTPVRGYAGGAAAHPRRPAASCHVITYGTEWQCSA